MSWETVKTLIIVFVLIAIGTAIPYATQFGIRLVVP